MKIAKRVAALAMACTLAFSGLGVYADSPQGQGSSTAKVTASSSEGTQDGVAVGGTYTGSTQKAKLTIKVNGKTLVEGKDFKVVSGGSAKTAGKHTMTIKGIGKYAGIGTQKVTYVIKKAKVTIKANKKKSLTLSRKKQHKLKLTVAKVGKAKDVKITVRKKLKNGKWSNVKQKNIFTIKNGKLVVKKGLAAYTYKVTLKVNKKNYAGKSVIKIKVKK